MKAKLLIICQSQYGYQIDYYNYCKYLKDSFDITYLCYDRGREMFQEEQINVIYLKNKRNKHFSQIYFIKKIIETIKKENFDIAFIYWFIGSSLVPIFTFMNKTKCILDLRSGSVSNKFLKRHIINYVYIFEATFFKHLTVITEDLRICLGLPKRKTKILPLGSDLISTSIKDFSIQDKYKLLYVGTFNNRNIQETIFGLFILLNEDCQLSNKIEYTIIGTGSDSCVNHLKQLVKKLDLENVVDFKGYVKSTDLLPFFDNANIGISFVPITDYFNIQPPTKTYEYLQAGIPVLATNTKANRAIINSYNGLLVNDNRYDFAAQLKRLIKKFNSYNSVTIRKTVKSNTWVIITKDLEIYLNKIITGVPLK